MAFRFEAFFAFSLTLAAQSFEFPAKHDRLLRDRSVTVRVDEQGMSAGAVKWVWDDIQQLTISDRELHVLSYKDSAWRGGRDREWLFENLPEGTGEKLYPLLLDHLGSRLVAALAMPVTEPRWEIPVKLRSTFGGSEGRLIADNKFVVYRSPESNESRTWRISYIENVSSAGPLDLVITTYERRGLLNGGPSDFRFQLKRPLAEERYEALWRLIQKSKGLEILQSYQGDRTK